ncbi:MAG TPA: M48 family metallopeptidase [Actinomycetes bacterium]|nr:M48 family metallopeptidase [Actinomycetes bacterium]
MPQTDPPAGDPPSRAVERARVALPQISSRAWEHPADRAALAALRRAPGFAAVLRTAAGMFSERRLRLLHLATTVRAGERQFRTVHRIKQDCVRILDLEHEPELYVAQEPRPNAVTLGLDRPFVVLSTGLLELLDDEELRVVVGHELGHVHSGHAVLTSLVFVLAQLTGAVGRVPFGTAGLRVALLGLQEWHRKAEISCDRAGLLAGQDPGAATRVHMKTAGGARVEEMSLVAFLEQAEEYQSAGDARDGMLRMLNLLGASHPFSALRVLELKHWVETGGYERTLAGEYPRRADDPDTGFRDEVAAAARSYRDAAADSQDPFVQLLRELSETAGGAAAGLAAWVRDAARRGGDGSG